MAQAQATKWSAALFVDMLPADPAALPAEFRIFKAGVNDSSKGPVTFDAEAARLVIEDYERRAVDCMIDLEHNALDPAIRPDSADARGWFKLEVRAGELWAVDVRWTPDGARRLAEKTQRYISPAFYTDETGRVVELINVALVAMPATYRAAPLVAASKRGCAPPRAVHTVVGRPQSGRPHKRSMDPTQVKAALDAIEAGDSAKALEILKAMIASAAGAEAGEEAAEGEEAMSDTADPPAANPADPSKDPNKQMQARLAKLEAEANARNKAMAERLAKLEADAADADRTERAALCGELVKLGYETPATAWEGDPEKQVPRKRFMAEPIEELRSRVEAYRKSPRASVVAPPVEGSTEIKLSKTEQAYCAKHGLTPEQFAAKKKATVRLHASK